MFGFIFWRSRHGPLDRLSRLLVPMAGCFLLGGCSTLDYYQQPARGQFALLRAREPVTQTIADPRTTPALRARLVDAQQARTFASEQLGLPDNRSYRLYADIHRPYVVWNLFATPEFSLEPVQHCFPIAGCVAYRGYYEQGRARGAAALMRLQGLDVYLGGVEAYSTLGWFDDPILSSMVGWDSERLASLIFHELAHQLIYAPGDTSFNESYATFVEREGTRQWRRARGLPSVEQAPEEKRDVFVQRVLGLRDRLGMLYAQPMASTLMRARKAALIEQFRQDYRQLRDSLWQGKGPYDAWVQGPINNAKLLPFGLYDQYVPAFARLYERAGQNWRAFHEAVRSLAGQSAEARQRALQALLAEGSV
ncbi:aminopeptidase [Pseudomonas sp. DC3000-4b1]|uniref:aminopeptidase n=1 Tax=unclassified Pseudomonas TaxID=196821 RepID=UPI003CEEA22B